MYRRERIRQAVLNFFLALLSFLMIMPFFLLILSSVTEENSLIINGYSFFPKKFSFDAYTYIFQEGDRIVRAYGITVFTTVVGTAFSVIITSLAAYPLSRKDFSHRKVLTFLIFFTMLFNGGIVPNYLLWAKYLKIKNTLLAYIIPGGLVTAFNVILVKNYYTNNIHPALIEAADIDGCSVIRTFTSIVLPLSLPILATVGMLEALNFWNGWVNGLYYINKPELYSLQVFLNRILQNIQFLQNDPQALAQMGEDAIAAMPTASARMAIAAIGVLPLLLVFPLFEKFFVKGISIGAVKE